MKAIRQAAIIFALIFIFSPIFAGPNCDCCEKQGGISYCDSSGGRFVCNNGQISACYCDRHAVMDLQLLRGCCLWQGGVQKVDLQGYVICNNGGMSATCSATVKDGRVVLR